MCKKFDCATCIHYKVCARLGGVGVENCTDYMIHTEAPVSVVLPCKPGVTARIKEQVRKSSG